MEQLVPKSKQCLTWFSFLVVLVCHHIPVALALSGDGEALLALKSFVDPVNSLPWRGGGLGGGSSSSSYASAGVVCNWKGVKQCNRDGRVTKLVVEHQNLTGTLDNKSLNQLDQLRVLSFKGNSISGHIPDLSRLANLKSLFLSHNNFSGQFPASIAGLHRLKVVVMAGNRLSGNIPTSMVTLRRLYVLRLEDNKLTGNVPALNQDSLRDFNVSGNGLFGRIPATATLLRFNRSSFSDNLALCGRQIHIPCNDRPPATNTNSNEANRSQNNTGRDGRVGKIIGGSVGGAVLLLIGGALGWFVCWWRRGKGKSGIGTAGGGEEGDGEGLGSLVFCSGGGGVGGYGLEELLKASAETLGRGSLGCTYKAVMESGYIVTVKRLKDAEYPSVQEFRLRMEAVGSLRHPNLVPLRAYFHAKEERLLVYDYFPNGSLFSLIHGSRTSGSGKPLHWTSCLKIAEDLATGLLYIHQNTTLPHGNLKSSNVLLGPDFASCLTDYCLTSLADPDSLQEPSAAATSLFYRAPECSRETRKPPTESADVYSFGVLLLELLTGKTPFQDLVQEHAADIPGWVRSAREQETDSDRNSSCNEASEDSKISSIVNIAASCVSVVPENRPAMKEVLKVIRDTRAEARVSSNSSGHSPGRWSDTIQSLPSKEHFGK